MECCAIVKSGREAQYVYGTEAQANSYAQYLGEGWRYSVVSEDVMRDRDDVVDLNEWEDLVREDQA